MLLATKASGNLVIMPLLRTLYLFLKTNDFSRMLTEFLRVVLSSVYVVQCLNSLTQFGLACTFSKNSHHQLSSSCFLATPLFSTKIGLEMSATVSVNSQEEDCKSQSTSSQLFYLSVLLPVPSPYICSLWVVLTLEDS